MAPELKCNVTVDDMIWITDGELSLVSQVGWGLWRINEGCSGSGVGWAWAVQYSDRQSQFASLSNSQRGKTANV